MTRPRLYINHPTELDWLIALEFGRVDDGQPPDWWEGVSDDFGWLHDGPHGPTVGFKVKRFSTFDPDAVEHAPIWTGPRFDAPLVGLGDATAGEIVIAAYALLDGDDTINRGWFKSAVQHCDTPQQALPMWLACLQSGDAMAHFGLGCCLHALGRHHESYRHLRHYTEIAPHCAWNWCWYGRAAEAIGELAEARHAYREALRLERIEAIETDAGELLAALDSPW